MTREEAIIQIKELKLDKNYMVNGITPFDTALNMAISALEAEPCEDAISRQAVLDIIEDRIKNGLAQNVAISQYYHMEVEKLPSVNPQEPKTGHWKQISPARIYECDICGQNVMTDDIRAYRYCHGCGAKMVDPQESEVSDADSN